MCLCMCTCPKGERDKVYSLIVWVWLPAQSHMDERKYMLISACVNKLNVGFKLLMGKLKKTWPHGYIDKGDKMREYRVRQMTAHFVRKPPSSVIFSSTLLSVILPFPAWIFQNNSTMTIDAEQSRAVTRLLLLKKNYKLSGLRSTCRKHTHTHTRKCISTWTFK